MIKHTQTIHRQQPTFSIVFMGGRGFRSELAEKIRTIQCNISTGSLEEKRLMQHHVALVFLILLCTLVFRFSGSKLKLRIPF